MRSWKEKLDFSYKDKMQSKWNVHWRDGKKTILAIIVDTNVAFWSHTAGCRPPTSGSGSQCGLRRPSGELTRRPSGRVRDGHMHEASAMARKVGLQLLQAMWLPYFQQDRLLRRLWTTDKLENSRERGSSAARERMSGGLAHHRSVCREFGSIEFESIL